MAVKILKSANTVAKLVGISAKTLHVWKEIGIKVIIDGSKFRATQTIFGKQHSVDHIISGTQMTYLLNDIVDSPKVIEDIRQWLMGLVMYFEQEATDGEALIDEMPFPKATKKKPAPQGLVAMGEATAADDKKSAPLLKNATKMYQLVKGTSGDSRYVVVAMGSSRAVAARFKGTKLSIRVEYSGSFSGFNIDTIKLLKESGFTMCDGGHASMHVEADSLIMASRALGAAISTMGLDWDTPLPNYHKALTKGS